MWVYLIRNYTIAGSHRSIPDLLLLIFSPSLLPACVHATSTPNHVMFLKLWLVQGQKYSQNVWRLPGSLCYVNAPYLLQNWHLSRWHVWWRIGTLGQVRQWSVRAGWAAPASALALAWVAVRGWQAQVPSMSAMTWGMISLAWVGSHHPTHIHHLERRKSQGGFREATLDLLPSAAQWLIPYQSSLELKGSLLYDVHSHNIILSPSSGQILTMVSELLPRAKHKGWKCRLNKKAVFLLAGS